MIDRGALLRKLESDEPLLLSAEEEEWLREQRILLKDPGVRLLLSMNYQQEDIRGGVLGTAMRIAAGLLPEPASMTARERFLVRCARDFLESGACSACCRYAAI